MLRETFEITVDRVGDVALGLLACVALAPAAGERGARGHELAVFVLFDRYPGLHDNVPELLVVNLTYANNPTGAQPVRLNVSNAESRSSSSLANTGVAKSRNKLPS